MKSATKKFLAFIMLITIVVGMIPTNLINVFASYPKGDGWEQIDGNTFIIYNNRITGTSLIEIFNLNGEVESDTYKFAYSDPDSEGVTWEDFGTEVINSSVYDIEFNTHDCAHIYFSPQKYWTSSIFYHIIVEKHYSSQTEPADSRNPAIIDNLQDKNFGKFDTEAEFMNAVKNRISASWANSEGSGKVDPSNIKVEFALNDSSVNDNGETVRSYTVTVNITEGANWLASEQKTVFEGVYWTVNQYVISFDSNGGTEVASIKADCGAPVTIPASPTRDGYEFRGWDLVGLNGVGDGYQDVVLAQMGKENITYVAIWRAKQFTVRFFDKMGYPIVALTLDYGDVIDVIDISEVTVPTGYTFIGWDLKKNGEYDGIPDTVSKTMGAENLEYQALFKVNQYTISFDTNGGSEIAPITQDFGTPVTLPERPTKIGYTFKGWDKEFPNEMPAKNLTLTARWEVNQYTLTFDTDGGTQIEPITLDYGANLTLPADPKKEHYVFAGWDIEIPTTMPAENITAKALWTPLDYTITFDTAGGSSIDPITKGYGEAVDIPPNPVKSGYNFIGWDKSIPSTMPGENITITALWEEATQKVSFDPNGGIWEDGSHDVKIETVNVNYNIENYSTPKLSGYDFSGWQKADTQVSDVDSAYIAVWCLGNKITFKSGDNITEKYYAVGEKIEVPQVIEKVGYTFVGWDIIGPNGVGDGFKDSVISKMENESITYIAIWEANKYTVIFYNENDEVIESFNKEYGTEFTLSITPIKTGYNFIGWDLKKNGEYDGIADVVSSMIGAENLEYKAVFKVNQYTISFDTNGGSEITSITQDYGTAVTLPEYPFKTGYTFVGWEQAIPLTMPSENIIIRAKWKINQYTITFDTDGGSDIPSLTQDYGTSVIAPMDPTKEHCTFLGWDKEIPTTIPAENITVKAQWVTYCYTITFDTVGGSLIPSIVQEYGTPVAKPSDPIKFGYNFIGWDIEIPDIMPGNNVTVTAIWEEATQKVSFDPNGGVWEDGSTDIKIETHNINYNIEKHQIPKRAGYDFIGWEVVDPVVSGADISYKSIWNLGKTVMFKDGDNVYTQNYAVGEKVSTPQLDEKIGYTFIGWDIVGPNGVGDGFKDSIISVMGNESVTYLAIWKVKTFTVQFFDDRGDLIEAHTLDYDDPIAFPEVSIPTGYTFVGWDLKKNGEYDGLPDAVSETMGTENLEYKTLFMINQYTIIFNTDGGNEIASITQDYGTSITPPAYPTKIGCTFDGWDKEIPSTMPAKNITITARWKVNDYIITFDTTGGSIIEPLVLKYGSAVIISVVPDKTGYTFAGWDKEIPAFMPAEDLTIKAEWTINQYTITFDTYGGNEVLSITQNYDTPVTIPPDPIKDYHTFAGWDKEIPTTMPAENLTIKAKWIANCYTITFDTSGGSSIDPITKGYGEAVDSPTNPVKSGYNFIGWDKSIPSTMPGEDITITALWEEATQKVSFDPNGGIWEDGSHDVKIETVNVNYNIENYSTPKLSGYNFVEWQKNQVASSNVDESYTAIWCLGNKITFKNCDNITEKYYAVGEKIEVPQVGEKTGYTFVGWDKVGPNGVGDGFKDTVGLVMGNESITYVAMWKEKIYTVKFYDEKGDLIEGNQYEYGTSVLMPEVVVPVGYSFVGWDLMINGYGDGEPDNVAYTMGAENLEYMAIFKKNEYTITFNTDGGSEIASITQEYGTLIVAPAKPTKLGCEFDGWDINIPHTMPAKNITITARWRRNDYTITFDTDGGTEIAPLVLKYGSDVSISNIPTKKGHTFAGWDKDIPETMPAENIILKATWAINCYTIIFNTDGGTTIDPITQDYGTAIAAPSAPVKEHYIFVGWDRELPLTMPAENVTLTAIWSPKNYTLTFDTVGGSVILPITQGYGTSITPPDPPKREGYKFIGWNREIPSVMPGENTVITAKWEEATMKVSLDPNGGKWSNGSTGIRTETHNYGFNPETYEVPIREGYNFVGWQKDQVTSSNADESYKAVWSLGDKITFKNGDSTTEKYYAVGEKIEAPQVGAKLGYTFVGWDKVGPNGVCDGFKDNVISVMGSESIVYVAIWEANTYTVIFYNENDEIIEAVTEKYGNPFDISIPPIKTGYEFVGWDLKIDGKYDGIADTVAETMGAENLEYRELFAIGQYTITFDSSGGSVVENITQSYGTDVSPPEHPTKEGYVFEGWDMGVPLTMPAKNITLTARWKKATYTISWDINGDGIINDYDIVTTVEYGDIPKLPDAEIPTKDSTVEFSYLFNNTWSPAIKSADSDATYTAQFDAVRRKYTVKFLNYDGVELQSSEVEYGSTPIYSGLTPTRYDDTQYEYTFAGWLPNIEIVTGAAEYRAEFDESIKKYTVIWQNWDGSILETDVEVEHGSLPTYDGKIPSRPSTVEKTYVFDGWDPQISGVTSNITYVASFTEKTNKYTVTWKNDDGSVIDITEVEYGKIPVHATPTKPSTPEYSYVFIGWTPSPVAVTDDATYTASYTAEKNKYSVIWNLGGVKTTEIYEYGAMPTFKGSTDKAAEGCTVFSFDCWDKAIESVTGNIEYTAKYSTMTVHTSDEIVFSDINKKTHDEYFACCNAARADNVAHTFVDEKCICGANEVVTVTVMISDGVFKTIEASPNTELSIDDISVPTPTKGYVFTGWYTADGVRVEGDIKLTNDLAIYAKFFAGDVDGSGKIEKSDVVALNRYIVGDGVVTVDDKNALDVNADGKITVADSVILMLYMAGKYS